MVQWPVVSGQNGGSGVRAMPVEHSGSNRKAGESA